MRRSGARAAIVVVIAAAFAACAALGGRAPGADLVHVTLLQINDHYVLEPVDGGRRGGMARLSTLVRDLKRENPNTIFALACDTLSPSVATALRALDIPDALWDALATDGVTTAKGLA